MALRLLADGTTELRGVGGSTRVAPPASPTVAANVRRFVGVARRLKRSVAAFRVDYDGRERIVGRSGTASRRLRVPTPLRRALLAREPFDDRIGSPLGRG